MQHFTISDAPEIPACNTCCCKPAVGKPGITDKWILDYSPIVLESNSQRLTDIRFDVVKVGCDNRSIVTQPVLVATAANTALTGDLTDNVDNPEGLPLQFSAVPFEGPKHGRLVLQDNGSYTYTPIAGYTGYDSFFWRVTVNGSTTVVQETVIGVGVAAPTQTQVTADVRISCVEVDNRNFLYTFSVALSPAAVVGTTYRLTVRAQYRDCDCCYNREDCFDINVERC